MQGAPVELDKNLGGVIAAIREPPTYFDETVASVKKAIDQAGVTAKAREEKTYSTKGN